MYVYLYIMYVVCTRNQIFPIDSMFVLEAIPIPIAYLICQIAKF